MEILDIQSGNVVLVPAAALIGLVALLRAVLSPALPWLDTDVGASTLTLVLGALGACLSAVLGGAEFSLELGLTSLKVTFIAMGGYSALKKLVLPLARGSSQSKFKDP